MTQGTTKSAANSAAEAAQADARRKQIIGVALMIVLIGGGVAAAWWKYHVPTLDEPLVDVPTGGNRFGFRMAQQPVIAAQHDGIRSLGTAAEPKFEVRSGDGRMVVSKKKSGEWDFLYRYQPDNLSSRDVRQFRDVKYRSSALKLTDDQKQQIDAVPYVASMIVSDENQRKLKDGFAAYDSAKDSDKAAAEAALVKTLGEVAVASEQPTRASRESYAAKIKALLTPEQVAKVTQTRTNPPNDAPAGAPTTGPAR